MGPGSWIFLTPAVLAWAAAATGTWSGILAVIALMAGITLDLGWYLPVNLPICLVIIGISALGGAAVGRSNRRKASAHERVVRRSSELTTATGAAVSAERLAVARDLHDVVSHAIAVMVMQAGAANALRGADPDRARAALAVVRRTASETLGGAGPVSSTRSRRVRWGSRRASRGPSNAIPPIWRPSYTGWRVPACGSRCT